MKSIFKIIPVLLLVFVFANISANAQGMALNSKERFLQLKKIKLLETLDMDEQTANQFLIKFSKMEKDLAQIRDELDSLNKNLKRKIKRDAGDKELDQAIKDIEVKMEQMHNTRKNFLLEAQKLLSKKQYAKFLLFEFSFEKQVHRLLMKKHRGRGNPDRHDDWED